VSEICSRGKARPNDEEEEKEERTMETSFVVSAAFWAPVATESQNDMAFLVAINVETEMVSVARVLSDFVSVGTVRRPRGRGGGSLKKREVAFFHTREEKRRIRRESAPRER
jgi:hypothetical protein